MFNFYKETKQKLKSVPLQELKRNARWIYKKSLKHKKILIIFTIIGMAGSIMGIASSVLSKYLIDAVTGYKTKYAGIYILLMIIFTLINIFIQAITSRYSVKVSIKVHNDIKFEIFQKILNSDWESISKFHSGDLLNRLSGDVSTISSGILTWFPSLVIQLVSFLATLGILLYYDPIMTLIAGICAPVSLILSKTIMRKLKSYNIKVREASSEIIAFEEETFQNLQLIKCFNVANIFNHKMKNIYNRYYELTMEHNKFSIYINSFLSIVGLIASNAAFGWGVYRLWTGVITYGTMTLFLKLSGSLSGYFSSITSLIPKAVELVICTGRIMEINNILDENEVAADHLLDYNDNFSSSKVSIDIHNMDFSYKNGHRVLNNINFNAEPGELIAIIGPSGEGKTTLFKILLGLITPSSGEAKLYNMYGSKNDISAATRIYFSYVPQGNSIFSGTIADNLRLVKSHATDEELIIALKTACAYNFIRELPDGLYTRVGERGLGLSEGQAQRIAIARALLRDAPILLLDEATSALDAETEAEVLKGIMEYGKYRICIVATHKNNILANCDRIYRIKNMELTKLKDSKDNSVINQYSTWNESIKLA